MIGQNASAQGLADFLCTGGKVKFANNETNVNLCSVRCHMRLLRRFSMAVANPSQPQHHESALWYFGRNEEIFGRRAPETTLQESARNLDALQSAIPDLTDLRLASGNLHVMLLRGYTLKTSGRHTAETAKALVLYSKIPHALFPRFPKYAGLLGDFVSMKASGGNSACAFPLRNILRATPSAAGPFCRIPGPWCWHVDVVGIIFEWFDAQAS